MRDLYRNKKNGRLYKKLFEAIDCTNVREGEKVVVYTDGLTKMFVREIEEFNNKFDKVQG